MERKDSINNASELFTNLFVLELANNHWGSVERGKQIIREHGQVVKKHGIKAAVKLQFRDTESFVKKEFENLKSSGREGEVVEPPGSSSRYVKKTIATRLSKEDFGKLFDEIKRWGMLTMVTPFDEKTVSWCDDFDIDIVKISSHDASTHILIDKIVKLGRPTIVSNGGTDIRHIDYLVERFKEEGVPLAINHCVSLYPSEDSWLELNQVDFLKKRYPDHVIGYSTHEYNDWHSSVMMTYAMGARTWERHIDIEDGEGTPVSKYCSLPHQVEDWFIAFHKAVEMCGKPSTTPREIPEKEIQYVNSVARGVYALRDLKKGEILTAAGLDVDYELAIPLQDSQFSAHDLNDDIVVKQDTTKGKPVTMK
ncbi:N-acetylneuraminate synthase family protein [Candidatus Nomurabacteria bacterium]|nr:N-acetylneuraminate synthase family protein [Candidatus Nomurabacteria bacterium]